MEKMHVEELIAEIGQMVREKPTPFPYPGCHFALESVENDFECFIPDLDLWSMKIAGYCSWGTKMLRCPREKLIESQSRMTLGFFEQRPDYRALEPYITESG